MPYATYTVYVKGKKAVYTSSGTIARKLEKAGYTRMFYVEGTITGADCQLMSGKIWLETKEEEEIIQEDEAGNTYSG